MADAVEQIVTRIWAEELGVVHLDRAANVFDQGATSLIAERVVIRLRSAFECRVPLRAVFERPTVAELAEMLGAG